MEVVAQGYGCGTGGLPQRHSRNDEAREVLLLCLASVHCRFEPAWKRSQGYSPALLLLTPGPPLPRRDVPSNQEGTRELKEVSHGRW